MEIDWQLLHAQALAAMKKAYVPYSHFPVGAAALVSDGRIVSGCNVENASYGLTLCAECGLVSDLIASGGGKLLAFSCVDINGNALMPCGRCRQLLQEHGGSALQLMTDQGVKPLSDLLPWAFGPEEITNRLPS
jgi:cytidine deaminase